MKGLVSLLLTIVATLVLPPVAAIAQTYTVLHNFNCASEGCGPSFTSMLAQGRDGNIYGTASSGPGTSGRGSVFRISPSGEFTTLCNFDGTNGSTPYGGLVLGSDGDFYGTTQFGTGNAGTIFKVTRDGVLTTLHAFPLNTPNGGYAPMTAPTLGNDGNYYGLTGSSGGTATGVAYSYSPSAGYKTLKRMTNALPGSGFLAPLLQGIDGKFYSTTYAGPVSSAGRVYSMSPTGVISVIYDFSSNAANGGWGYAPLVEDTRGYFYGTEAQGGPLGGGVVFRVTRSGELTLLHSFIHQDQSGGNSPSGGLVLATDGNLYGSTYYGGSHNDGVLFKVTKPDDYTQLLDFDGADGVATESTPMQHTNGKIYGISMNGGLYGGGVLYSIDAGMHAFVSLLYNAGPVGKSVGILGQGLENTTAVSFNGTPANFRVISNTFLKAIVPSGATTGFVTVSTSTNEFKSNRPFAVRINP